MTTSCARMRHKKYSLCSASGGSHTVIDKITVMLNIKEDRYEAELSNLGLKNIPIHEDYPTKYDRLLCGGI